MKLNLGCGFRKLKGYINCDVSTIVKPDRIVDLEKKLPFKNDSVDEIILDHVLEHIHNFVPLMHELWRICEKGAVIRIKVPFYSSWGQFNDPTHVRFFTPFTFDYFGGVYAHHTGSEKTMFGNIGRKINFGIGPSRKLNFLLNPVINMSHKFYCRFLSWVLPAAEICYELKVIK
jgi:SAM-dependent methyltransferase